MTFFLNGNRQINWHKNLHWNSEGYKILGTIQLEHIFGGKNNLSMKDEIRMTRYSYTTKFKWMAVNTILVQVDLYIIVWVKVQCTVVILLLIMVNLLVEHNMYNAVSLMTFNYLPLRVHCIIYCCVDRLQLLVCLHWAISIICW